MNMNPYVYLQLGNDYQQALLEEAKLERLVRSACQPFYPEDKLPKNHTADALLIGLAALLATFILALAV